jgi:hypothetical protein
MVQSRGIRNAMIRFETDTPILAIPDEARSLLSCVDNYRIVTRHSQRGDIVHSTQSQSGLLRWLNLAYLACWI